MRYAFVALCLSSNFVLSGPVPRTPPKPVRTPIGPGYEPRNFMGRVEAIGGTSIVIKPEGHLRIDITWLTADGKREERHYEQDNNQPSRIFVFSDRMLALNGFVLPPNRTRLEALNRGEHTIGEVRAGDRVQISYGTVRGQVVCTELCIVRRPGGRVPDAYGDNDPAYKAKLSTTRNAEQFVEETVAGKWAPRLLAGLKK